MPKKGKVAEPGLVGVAPGRGVMMIELDGDQLEHLRADGTHPVSVCQ